MSSKLEELKKLREQLNIQIDGVENYPKGEKNLIIANHSCLMDIFYLPIAVPEEHVSIISSRLTYKKDFQRLDMLQRYLNVMPLEVHAGANYTNLCIESIVELFKTNGISLNIFPQGAYLTEDNFIYRGRTGVARILYEARKEITDINFVPVSIDLVDKKDDLDSYQPEKNLVRIKILEPIDYEDHFYNYEHSNSNEERNVALHAVVDDGMRKIADSLGKQYSMDYIELYKRKDIILSDGSVIDVNDTSDIKYLNMLKGDLNNRVKVFSKKMMKQN